MLPSELLRARTRSGRISPMFCATKPGTGTDHGLAGRIIACFADAQKSGRSRGDLSQEVAQLESEHDHRLVRGLYALLERRSVFVVRPSAAPPGGPDPSAVRRALFAESASRGWALSEPERGDIVRLAADRMRIPPDQVEAAMWGDREENMVPERFEPISPEELILWYNRSLVQTLLFRCTALRFRLRGGAYWKRVLRNVKRYGLMYTLEYDWADGKGEAGGGGGGGGDPESVTCVLEGPLSLFRMTDRYGTAIAKLLPYITEAPEWEITGSIMKKTDGGPRIYRFEMSNRDAAGFLRSGGEGGGGKTENGTAGGGSFDSELEAAFEKRFRRHFGGGGGSAWRISREPGPLIADGKAMIPDFVFERFGRRVYLEIVGFWTKEYLERKAAKLKAIFDGRDGASVDLLVAVNSELACSQIRGVSADRVFEFKKEVPIKPVLEHLKRIDEEIIVEKTRCTRIELGEGGTPDVISVGEVSDRYDIPREAAARILAEKYPGYITSGSYMISKAKADAAKKSLKGMAGFVEACTALAANGIPEPCHADVLAKLGYDVVWSDLDPGNARITSK